jgi:hypothetical protein
MGVNKNFKDFKNFEATASTVRGIAVLIHPYLQVEIYFVKTNGLDNQFRKEVSKEAPQYNGGLSGLQKREYLATITF